MKKSLWLGAFALVALAWSNQPVQAQACAGDCNGDQMVAINELISCVNIALGNSALSTCSACDLNGDGMVAINELITAVNAALCGCGGCGTPGPTPSMTPTGEGFCGDGAVNVEGEECDDGNNFGGDGCAANCTNEIRRTTMLDPDKSKSTVQLQTLPIVLTVTGTQTLTAGTARDTAVIGPGGVQLFAPNQIPLALKTADVQFDPVVVTGIACACVRALDVEVYGPGNSGSGVVGCGDEGLTDIDFLAQFDHNTTPGSAGNSGPENGLPDDPDCNSTVDAGAGLTSSACLEAPGAACNPSNPHPGVCNSPRVLTFSGGQAARGAVILRSRTQIGVLNNATNGAASCTASRNNDGSCKAPDFGDDCMPCTDDDKNFGTPNTSTTTSGTASVALYDANNTAGASIVDGKNCGARPCVAKVTGEGADCDALLADPNSPLTGALVTGFAGLDGNGTGDTVTTTTLAAQH